MLDESAIISFLQDETYMVTINEETDFLGIQRLIVNASVRGMIDNYSRVYALVGVPLTNQSRKLYTEAFVSLGHDAEYANGFTVAVLTAKTKGMSFNFEPESEEKQTGSGNVGYINQGVDVVTGTAKDIAKLPGEMFDIYRSLPFVALALGAGYLFFFVLPKPKK